ncbi:MAG: DUF349 domain-containing protein [Balneolales bacterium]
MFENKYGYVTGDGHLVQKDNPFFKGRELSLINTEKIDDALEYYQHLFNKLEAYVDKVLKMIDASPDKDAQSQKLDTLTQEIIQSNAIGDFDALLSKVNAQKASLNTSAGPLPEEPASGDHPLAADPETDEAQDQNNQPVLRLFEELTSRAEALSKESDWQYTALEFDNLRLKWEKLPVPDDREAYNVLWGKFRSAEADFQKRKAEHQLLQRNKKQSNLEKRQHLLEKLRQLVANKKWQAIDEVRSIERRWDAIKKLPADEEAKIQDEQYKASLALFDKNKVEYLVNTRQKEEDNLTGKLAVLEKLEEVVAEAGPAVKNWEVLDKRIEEFSTQWKKIGPVPKENTHPLRNKYREAKEAYYDKKLEFNPAYRKELERNHEKMLAICEETEKLKDEKDLALAARQINILHKRWKKVGSVPRKYNETLWERFKAASDTFNKRKVENLDVLRDQEQGNYELKKQLCDQAEVLNDTGDLIKGAREMDALMGQWKEIGPVPKNKSGKIWRRFKKAMDVFYKRRRGFFKEQREEQKKNLEAKKQLIGEINELATHEDAGEAVELVKPLQEKFNQIGFVPIKKKDVIYKEFKEACDVVYGRARTETRVGEAPRTPGVSKSTNVNPSRKITSQVIKLRKECDKLNEEILHFEDYITFVKPSKKGNQLRDQIQEKIDTARAKVEEKLQRIDELNNELDADNNE